MPFLTNLSGSASTFSHMAYGKGLALQNLGGPPRKFLDPCSVYFQWSFCLWSCENLRSRCSLSPRRQKFFPLRKKTVLTSAVGEWQPRICRSHRITSSYPDIIGAYLISTPIVQILVGSFHCTTKIPKTHVLFVENIERMTVVSPYNALQTTQYRIDRSGRVLTPVLFPELDNKQRQPLSKTFGVFRLQNV